jgi:hypothetical protein
MFVAMANNSPEQYVCFPDKTKHYIGDANDAKALQDRFGGLTVLTPALLAVWVTTIA